MTHRYVWFDDVDRLEVVRAEFRMPKPLHDFLVRTAKAHDVSTTALVIGLLAYAADSDAHQRLRIERVPAVRVSEFRPGDKPVKVPLLDAGPLGRVSYHKGKAR